MVHRVGIIGSPAPVNPRTTLHEELRRHALIVGEVTLTSGRTAQYYVDAKRAILRPAGFRALAELVAGHAARLRATAVGGLTMGADAPACAALAGGAEVKAFFVRKEAKAHGLQRRIEGPDLEPGERCLVVEDVVTTGGSTVQAIEAVREAGLRGLRRRRDPRPAGGRRRGDRRGVRRRALRGARHDRRHLPGPAGPRRSAAAFAAAPPLRSPRRNRRVRHTADRPPCRSGILYPCPPHGAPPRSCPRPSPARSASPCSPRSARPSGCAWSATAVSATRCRGCSPPCSPARRSAPPAALAAAPARPRGGARGRARARARRARLGARAAAARARPLGGAGRRRRPRPGGAERRHAPLRRRRPVAGRHAAARRRAARDARRRARRLAARARAAASRSSRSPCCSCSWRRRSPRSARRARSCSASRSPR